jgi:hypothetical protein
MAYEKGVLDFTFNVSGNGLSADNDQFIFVSKSDTDLKIVPSGADDNALGVSQETGKDGRGISVRLMGITKLRLGGTVSYGDYLSPDSSGNAVFQESGGPAPSARALGAGVSGDVISALLIHTQAAT